MTFRSAFLFAAILVVGGCSALGSINDASVELDAYTLSPLPVAEAGSRNLHLVVQLPTSAGALATDRILIKPSPVQAQYLPDGRWTDPAPVLVQTLLLASLQNQSAFTLIDRDGGGLLPDFTLSTELQDFQAEPAAGTSVTVRISTAMTLIRESDLSIIATRRFTTTSVAASDSTAALVSAFDTALRDLMSQAVGWVRQRPRNDPCPP